MARMKSLSNDRNDQNELRWGRIRNMGTCVASEFYQPVPMFFTREGAQLNIIGQYRGHSAFLVASGPSLKEMNMDLLNKSGVWSMTLNNAVRTHRGQAACIVDDPSRFIKSLWLDPCIQKFVPFAVMEKPLWDNENWKPLDMKVGDCPNVIAYRRNEKFMPARYLYEDTINWGCHKQWGGGRSVMLAAIRILFLLGFRNVYLVGVDFEMNDDKKYHFDEGRTNSAIRGNMSTYKKMQKWWKELNPRFLAENFVVKNCNPNSKLEAFPYHPLEDAVKDAAGMLGDVENERTRDMYTTYEDKVHKHELKKRQKDGDPKPKGNVIVAKDGKPLEKPVPVPDEREPSVGADDIKVD